MASLIIGIMGKKRSGKDTFAERLVEAHGFTRLALADPLRAMAKALDPIVDIVDGDSVVGAYDVRLSEVLGPEDDWETAKEIPEVRRILQRMGTEAGRGVLGDDVWVDALARRVDAVDGPVVVTDVRFPDEADYIKAAGGHLARIVRPGLVSTDEHVSETALDDRMPDIYVRNGSTIEELHYRADIVARTASRNFYA